MKLNQGQQKALDGFKDFLLNDDPDERLFILEGYSGCGKSTMIANMVQAGRDLLNYVESLDPQCFVKSIAVTATTNQAADTLGRILKQDTVNTYHSFMAFTIRENYNTGETDLDITRNTVVLTDTILVIDEASYMTDEEIDLVLKYLGENCKLVLVGDPCQLLGVGSTRPDAFYRKTNYHYYLTEVMRQAGKDNLILELGEQHREAILNQEKVLPQIIYDNKSIVLCDGSQYELTLNRLYKLNPNGQRALSFRNANVIEDNKYIRTILGYPDNHFTEGELVLSNSMYYSSQGKQPLLLGNNELAEIQRYSHHTVASLEHHSGIKVVLDCDVYNVRSCRTGQQVNCVVPRDIDDYYDTVKQIAEMARSNKELWSVYFKLKKNFADIRPAYASTVHKAQGLTLDYACLDLEDVDSADIDMALRLRYVGITRAAKTAYLYVDE